MRFAQTACKFEELHFCHQFFNNLLSLFGTISPNVAKEGDLKSGDNGQEGHHPKILQKVLQNSVKISIVKIVMSKVSERALIQSKRAKQAQSCRASEQNERCKRINIASDRMYHSICDCIVVNWGIKKKFFWPLLSQKICSNGAVKIPPKYNQNAT